MTLFKLFALFFLFLLVISVGCGSSDGNGGDDETCDTDTDCAADEYCGIDGNCYPMCNFDADCEEDYLYCTEDNYCDLKDGACDVDGDCEEGETCEDHWCTGGTETGDLSMKHSGVTYDGDDSYHIPDNRAETASVVIFSEQLDVFTITNNGGSAMTINGMAISLGTGIQTEEFQLIDYASAKDPLAVSNLKIEPAGTYDFYIRFFPVASGTRFAVLTITYNTSSTYRLNITGTGGTGGQSTATLFTHGTVAMHKLFGGIATDDSVGGLALDSSGNAYFTGYATEVIDNFAYDLIIAKVATDGSLAWKKIWTSNYRDAISPAGDGPQGGAANSIGLDSEGYVYVAGFTNDWNGNPESSNMALILKINPADGTIVWEKLWTPGPIDQALAKNAAKAFSVDVRDNYVYVVGTTGAFDGTEHAFVMFLVLNKTDGSIVSQNRIDIASGYNDRGYTVKAAAEGIVYIAGYTNNKGFVARVSSANTATPIIEWMKKLDVGTGAVNAIDVDSSGNVYLSLDYQGSMTTFGVAKLSTAGELFWAKSFGDGGASENNNAHVVRVVGDAVYAGGRIGISDFDNQDGDGFIMKLSATDGSLTWASFYYTGKGTDELAVHRVKGLGVINNTLYILGQIYTGQYNGLRYWGYWYDGLASYCQTLSLSVTALSPTLTAIATGVITDAATYRQYLDVPALLDFGDADDKHDGNPPDEDIFFMKMTLQ